MQETETWTEILYNMKLKVGEDTLAVDHKGKLRFINVAICRYDASPVSVHTYSLSVRNYVGLLSSFIVAYN